MERIERFFLGAHLEEGVGEGDEEGGDRPKQSSERYDVGAVVAGGQVRREGVAGGLDDGSEEGEGAEAGGRGVQRRAHLLVHRRKERLVGSLHDRSQVHQDQRPLLRRPELHPLCCSRWI